MWFGSIRSFMSLKWGWGGVQSRPGPMAVPRDLTGHPKTKTKMKTKVKEQREKYEKK